MKTAEAGTLVRIFIPDAASVAGEQRAIAVLRLARESGVRTSAVLRPWPHAGGAAASHALRAFGGPVNGDLVVELLDCPERIESLLPHLDDVLGDAVVTLMPVQMFRHGGPAV